MPILPLWSLALFIGGTGWVMTKNKREAAATTMRQEKATAALKKPEKIESLLTVDPMELEWGINWCNWWIRPRAGLAGADQPDPRQIAIEFGVVVPPIRYGTTCSLIQCVCD